ncbi:MAG: hypothetical protein HYU52_18315 [Acidobacteria bacterium]|nr:hypothetical protein [Acidobacteriota bacterium]
MTIAARVILLPLLTVLLLASCASRGVDMEEPNRVLGKEDDVRVDAQFFAQGYSQGSNVSIVYEIENLRTAPIAFASMTPEIAYEGETGVFTVTVGSEVPGNELVPRLIEIKPGERVKLTAGGRLIVPVARDLLVMAPREIRLKLVYLKQVEPFRELIGIPEVAVRDPALADKLFPSWIEHSATVITNTSPIRWGARKPDDGAADRRNRF